MLNVKLIEIKLIRDFQTRKQRVKQINESEAKL